MVDSTRGTPFESALLRSRLVTPEQLETAWSQIELALVDSDPSIELLSVEDRLANKLVELGYINRWQAQQLLLGRSKFNLGPYWIIESIGQGGMGQVFKARDEILGRLVAVKVLPRHMATPEAVANFRREIQAQARLDHPNLVRALDSGEDGKVCYLVTEYVPGPDLRKLVRAKGPMNMERAAHLISQAACALQHAHEQGLVHRDVKPGNILVTPDGEAKLSDLGLAGPLQGDLASDPRFGRIVGTADYLSPDHIQSPWEPTPAWDIYSLGCTLYYAVTGKVPFPGGSTRDKVHAHLRLRPLDPRRLNPHLSSAFVEVLADMMAKDPRERIATAAEVVARLAPWVTGPERGILAARLGKSGRLLTAVPYAVASGEEDEDMDDTESEFPELPQISLAAAESPGQTSQATHRLVSPGDATFSRFEMQGEPLRDALPLAGPLAIFLGFPLAVITLVAGLAYLVRLLW